VGRRARAGTDMRRGELAVVAALAAVALVAALLVPTYPNYDTCFHLVWGRELMHGMKPDFKAYAAPTEHPLFLALCALVGLVGTDGERLIVLVCVLSLVALVWATFRVGDACFGLWPALAGAVFVGSSFAFLLYAARAYVDVPFLALVLWAAALEARAPRRGLAVMATLAVAGLLRPEAWVLAGAYWLWCGWRRFDLLALAAAAPLAWCLVDLWVTGVEVQHGPLLASVGVMRTDAAPANATAIALARTLSARVQGVLAGRVRAPAVELPAVNETGKQAIPPAVAISGAALRSSDVGGASITRGEYVSGQTAVSAYVREFGGAKVGRSQLMSVENDISLLSSDSGATAMLAGVRGALHPSAAALKQLIRRQYAQPNSVRLDSVEIVRQRTLKLTGGHGYEVVAHLTTLFGQFDAAWIFVSSGRLFGTLHVTSSPGSSLAEADLQRMSLTLAKRMHRTCLHLTPAA